MVQVLSQYVSRKAMLLVTAEGILIAAALLFGVKLRFWSDPGAFAFYTMLPDFAVQVLAVMICFQVSFYYNELYEPHAVWRPIERLDRLRQALGLGCVLIGLLYLLFPSLIIGRGVFLIALLIVVTSVTATRVVVDLAWRAGAPRENVLIVGTGKLATEVARAIRLREDLDLGLVGFVEPGDTNLTSHLEQMGHLEQVGAARLGDVQYLSVPAHGRAVVSRVIVAVENPPGKSLIGELLSLRTRGIRVEDAHSAIAALTGRIPLETLPSSWFVFSEGFCRTQFTVRIKRLVDLLLGLGGLLVSAPFMALIGLGIKLDSPGPVLYRQARVGYNGRPFQLLKFRSMREDAEAAHGAQWAAEDDPRATRLGRHLRKYRLDELPQFLNVIRGEMSFVGPRPERPEMVEGLRTEIPYYDERHTVRPGITGWAQVRYPYSASLETTLHKLEYDLFYLKNMSLIFDGVIVLRTVKIVLFGRGAR